MFVASLMQHTKISRLEMFLERCCITVACGRKRLASECLLHQRCNALGFRGWRDVAGEMLHHSGMHKEEVSEQVFVASLIQHTRVSRLERCCWRDVASRRHVKGTG